MAANSSPSYAELVARRPLVEASLARAREQLRLAPTGPEQAAAARQLRPEFTELIKLLGALRPKVAPSEQVQIDQAIAQYEQSLRQLDELVRRTEDDRE